MYDIRTTADFDTWLRNLKDRQAVKAIVLRLTRAEAGNLGDIKSVGGHISLSKLNVSGKKAVAATAFVKSGTS